MKMRIKAIPIRINPREAIIVSGLLADAIHIECKSVDECNELWDLLNKLRQDGVDIENNELTKRQRSFLDRLRQAGLLSTENERPCQISIIGKGHLASLLRENLKDLGVKILDKAEEASLRVYAYDFWSPRELRKIDEESLKYGFSYIPIYLVLDMGIIGPHVIPNSSANYICFESQLMASMTWAYRVFRDYVSALDINLSTNPVYIRFLSALASLILLENCRKGLELVNRVIVVDFRNIFIDVIKIYRTPSCIYE